MPISKRLRFEILRRDNYTCRYCGASAPEAKLTIDHVTPTALGGRDEPTNLVTACQDCNTGKTSIPPDAPTVNDVAEHAIRWAHTMKIAGDQMVADLNTRKQARAAFDEKWREWTIDGKTPLPRPDTWEQSIDNFLAAGLPLPILLECVDMAMAVTGTKVKPKDTFRYMCGIAWNKVADLQKAAQAIAAAQDTPQPGDENYDPDLDPRLAPGREHLARELLHYLGESESTPREDWEDDLTPTERVVLDITTTIGVREMRRQELERWVADLQGIVYNLLSFLPFDEVREVMSATAGTPRTPERLVTAVRDVVLRLNQALLDTLPGHEKADWLEYAKVWRGQDITEEEAVNTAAHCVRVAEAGRHPAVMCSGRGQNIKFCPRRATYTAYFDHDCPNCTPAADGACTGHGFCDEHMEQVRDGSFFTDGKPPLTLISYEPRDAAVATTL